VVVAGEIVAGRLVRLACQRHLRDLETGPARGLRWDLDAALRILTFFGHLRLPADGEVDGLPFVLQPFEQFIVGSLFGWKGAEGLRRFRTAFIEIAKGNGKTPMAAGIGLYGLLADGRMASEIYSAATTSFQAGILFRDARRMAEASPALRARLKIDQHNLAHVPTDSFMRPVSSEHRQLSGPRPHMALLDEIHEHPNSLVVDKMRAGTKNDRTALIFEITNSGADRQSVCWDHHEYSVRILEGQREDDGWFAFVCGLDPCAVHLAGGREFPEDTCPDCDSWTDERVWPKANPGLGSILSIDYLREQVREAKGMPSKEGIVKRLNFCIWTERVTVWIPAEIWVACKWPVARAALKGQRCWGGLDLANRFDLNALVLVFRDELPDQADELVGPPAGAPVTRAIYTLLPFFWMPREAVAEREQKDRVAYRLWESQGLITFTDGNVTDYAVIEQECQKLTEEFDLVEVAYDPREATQLATTLNGWGLTMLQFNQNVASYNEPTKEFEALVRCGRLRHPGHAVLDWQAGNAAVLRDRYGRMRPLKPGRKGADGQWLEDPTKKVDGIQAAVMGLARAMLAPSDDRVGVEFW